ncbi:MAG: hypothetical protein ACKVZJ_07035 [Phycisphaerales bacterium]
MRLLFVLDRSFAQREHALVRRVEVGLLDEGVRLTRCVPHACALQLPSGLIPQATYADTGPKIALPWRADRLYRDLQRLATDGSPEQDGLCDAVHAWGGARCWDLAAELAEADGADLVVEVFSAAGVEHARRFERRWQSVLPEPGRCAFSVPTDELRQAAERAGVRWPVRVCPWGVFVPDTIRPARRPGAPASLCVVGGAGGGGGGGGGGGDSGGGDDAPTHAAEAACIALLEGVAELSRRREALESAGAGTLPELLVFLDERLVSQSPSVWRYVQRLDLTSCVSVVADMEGRRDPLLRADMLALPEPTGAESGGGAAGGGSGGGGVGGAVQRSILLDAMAAGVTVLVAHDELNPHAQHMSTAWVVSEPRARLWCDALERLLSDLDLANGLAEAGRQYVATHCLASAHAKAVLALHERRAASA